MLALYTFKEHGGASTEATTVRTTGHDVDTRSSISMPTAKGATLLSRSMKSRVPNVQASVSQKKGTTVSTAGHDVDTMSSISMPTAKLAALPSRSMKSHVPNVQASVSRDVPGINADVAYVNKLLVKEMEEELKFNAQHHSGTKEILRQRIIDGLAHGPLVATCLICRKGRLKICDTNPNLVRCRGYYDIHTRCHVSCHYSANATQAPRRTVRWYQIRE